MNKPTEEEIRVAIKTINDLAIFAANHNVFTQPVPELMKVTAYLETLKDEGTNG